MSELGRDDDTPRRDFERAVLKQADKEDTAPRAAEAGEERTPPSLVELIRRAINSVSAENASNTPDFILSNFLMNALAALDTAVQQRDRWYGRPLAPGGQEELPMSLRVSSNDRAPGGQNAATQVGQVVATAPSHEGHAAGPAVAAPDFDMMQALKNAMAPPAPAEVAEGAGPALDRTFEYLLNAFEQASQSDEPAKNGYRDKRRALFDHVAALRAKVREAVK